MTTAIKLSDTQRAVLEHAANHPSGTVDWFPPSCKGGAIGKVITSLYNKDLITDVLNAEENLRSITAKGYEALGRARPTPATNDSDREVEAAVTAAETTWGQEKLEAAKPAHRTRDNTKQAQVIAMLKRPEGATIQQICELTGWQKHTARGTIAGTLKKKLGLAITSSKELGFERVYRA